MGHIKTFFAAAAILAGVSTSALAAPVTSSFTFSGSSDYGAVSGSATATYDLDGVDGPTTLTAFNLAIGSVTFELSEVQSFVVAATDLLTFGTNCSSFGCSVSDGVESFYIFLSLPDGATSFLYSNGQSEGVRGGTLSFAVSPADIPEPAALSLLGLGIFGIAAARRRTSPQGCVSSATDWVADRRSSNGPPALMLAIYRMRGRPWMLCGLV